MKIATFYIIALFAIIGFSSPAQFLIGPQAGFNIATLSGTSFSVSTKPGWDAGVFISIPINKHFALMPAALYSMRGFKYNDTTTAVPRLDSTVLVTTNVNASLGYLDVPVLLTYFTQETKGFMLQAGPQISFLITDNSTIETTATPTSNSSNTQPKPTANTVSFNKSDISLVGGIGYKFPQLLVLYARASTGFAKVQDGGYVKNSDRGHSFVFQAGAALSFGGK